MATSNKDFKIKNGLIVEGSSATVNGNDVLTSASSIDDLDDVSITTPADSQVLAYEAATSLWKNVNFSGGSSVIVSATPPTDPAPTEGNQWFDSSTGTTYIYYDDFWVPVSPPKAGPTGATGETGDPGVVISASAPESTDVLWLDTDEDGVGIPLGGTAGQVLAKIDSGSFNTEWIDVYTPAQTDNAISAAVSNLIDSAPSVLDTLNELSSALNDDPNFSTTVANALAALVPSGTINQTARATAPTGYLLCDGSAISRSTYSSLFDAIGTAYGTGDGSTTFNIPNLKGRVPVGYDSSQTEFDTLGETGGAKTHALTTAEIPSHTHSVAGIGPLGSTGSGTLSLQADGNLVWYRGDGTVFATGGGASGPIRELSLGGNQSSTSGSSGSGGAHNNLQPYVVLNYMIKV